MQPVELTFLRALKVFWSFIWRAWILMFPASIVLVIVAFGVFFLTGGIESFRHLEPGQTPKLGFGVFFLMYLIFIPLMMAVQVYAMRLALRVKWSDFELVAVGPTKAQPQSQPYSVETPGV